MTVTCDGVGSVSACLLMVLAGNFQIVGFVVFNYLKFCNLKRGGPLVVYLISS